jgi:hypothetical protein
VCTNCASNRLVPTQACTSRIWRLSMDRTLRDSQVPFTRQVGCAERSGEEAGGTSMSVVAIGLAGIDATSMVIREMRS